MISPREGLGAGKTLRIISRRPPRSFWLRALKANEIKIRVEPREKLLVPFGDEKFFVYKDYFLRLIYKKGRDFI